MRLPSLDSEAVGARGRSLDLPYELESEEYWAHVDWVLECPSARSRMSYARPMFEVRKLRPCEEPEISDEDCACRNL